MSASVKDSGRAGSSVPPVNLTINDAVQSRGISRSRLYLLLGAGEVEHRKLGRRTIVIARSLDDYIDRQPPASIRAPKAA